MPSATWKGAVSFGLVAIPVRLYRANEAGGVSFRMLCASCGSPIQNRRWCPEEEKLIEWGDVERGFEVAKDEFVELSDRDLERLPLPSTETIEVLEVVAEAEIDQTLYLQQSYYLEPEPAGTRPYALLRRALAQTGRSAIGKITMHQREHLCQLSARDELMVLTTLHWPDEIRSAAELKLPEARPEVSRRELSMALTLLENMSAHFDPDRYQDEYREALLKLVTAKRARRSLPKRSPRPRGDNVVDLMSALKAAVDQTRPRSGPAARGRGKAVGPRPARTAAGPARRRRAS